jgi:hypothetical protein
MNINKNYTFSDSNDTNVLGQVDTIREFSTTIDREAVYEDTQVENKL